ncbi:MAG: 4Fe-4S dicluster domain-containing protein [Sandaracinus sp.]
MSKREPLSFRATSAGVGTKRKTAWRSIEEKRAPRASHEDVITESGVQVDASFESGLVTLGKKKAEPSNLVGKSPDESAAGPFSRRQFLTVTGAAAAAAALQGCIRRPMEHILPYTRTPEYALPGVAIHFATALSHAGEAVGVLVESHEGRPTKIEGNAAHPASNPQALSTLGGTDAQTQAAILGLYDQDRSAELRRSDAEEGAEAPSWADFDAFLASRLEGGAQGLRFLLAPFTSPTVHRLRHAVLERFPSAQFHTWAPVTDGNAREGVRLAYGTAGRPVVDFARARVVVSLDSDFLGTEPGMARNARSFAAGRVVRTTSDEMNRLYVVESTLSTTGTASDHRLRLASSDIAAYGVALARALQTAGVDLGPLGALEAGVEVPEAWTRAVAEDLVAHRGQAVVVVGSRQPPALHALAIAINAALRANDTGVVSYTALVDDDEQAHTESLSALVQAMSAGDVRTLVICGSNPVYDAPSDLGFTEALGHVECSIHLASHDDETSEHCTWHLPMAHELESWGDHRSIDGTLAIQQPLIAPLRGGRNLIELLAAFAGEDNIRAYHQVRQTFANLVGDDVFDGAWRRALHSGVVAGAEPERVSGTVSSAAIAGAARQLASGGGEGWEVVFASCARAFDGSVINNPWLLELPDPVTKLTWDNAAMISPAAADELGIPQSHEGLWRSAGTHEPRIGHMVRISKGDRSIEIPVVVVPGHADHSITLPLGWGRTRAGSFANGCGFDVYPLRTSEALHFERGFDVSLTGARYELAITQEHHSMNDGNALSDVERPIVIEASLEEYRQTPNFAQWREPTPETPPLWQEVDYSEPRLPAQGGPSWGLVPVARPAQEGAGPRHAWAMTIDLTLCTGCSTCIVACNAENNVPTVGKLQVQRGREMHWMRLDRYFLGDDEANPTVAVQPVGCQHCEEAPCENVCPVNATEHSPEGLNEMAYNRCIGTRYCMNNCPYKVRRFNYLAYQGHPSQLQRMQFNPNVSVRMRGVMEKCTYCTQRIQAVRIAARNEGNREIRDGEITPACAQACPTQAITFGDLNGEGSRVAQLASSDRHYKLLALVGTQPRTTYLGRIRNTNPAMQEGGV